jgi:Zn-dependent protease
MNKQYNIFKDILFIFPVMGYYALEAIIVGIFITIIWKLFLSMFFCDVGYLQIIAIYWIVKMLLFNVFNLITGLASAGSNMQMEEQNKEFENEV